MRKEIDYEKKRYIVLFASCMINLCIGALYAWSVFSAPMASYLSGILGREIVAGDLAIVFSVGNSLGFITMIGGGFLNQKIGPRAVILLGGTIFGFGFVLCGLAKSVMMLIIGYGLCSGLAMGLAYGCTISNSVKFFPDKAGLVGGIATASYGISSVILPPIANKLIQNIGVNRAFIVFGVTTIVVVLVCSGFIVKCPEGFCPKGYLLPQKEGNKTIITEKNWNAMLKTQKFYSMLFMLFFGAVLGMMAISQASNMAQNMAGMSPAEAALVVSILALFNTFGRVICGMISDHIGCIKTIQLVFLLAITSMLFLYFNKGVACFIIGVCMAGVCFGAFMGVYPSFTAEEFGRTHANVNYGILFIGFNLAGYFGPIWMSSIYRKTNSYQGAFLLCVIFAILGLALSFTLKNEKRKHIIEENV